MSSRDRRHPHGHSGDAIIGRAFRWSVLALVIVAGLAAVGVYVHRLMREEAVVTPEATLSAPRSRAEVQAPSPPEVPFTDITRRAGIDFIHTNGAQGDKLLPETMGGGVAFLDYDGDGDQDLLFVNSMQWTQADDASPVATQALYRNDGTGRFGNVTQEAGLGITLYGMGVATGDYDNDGDADLFITAVGTNRLLRNDGGVFTDVTGDAGVGGQDSDWSTSAAFVDYDNDGDLDLFVANYVHWSREIDLEIDFRLTGLGRAYGPPTTFEGSYPYLYRNDGNGRFTDVSAQAGVQVDDPATGQPMGKGLGVMPVDIDRDGLIDLFVSNDTVQNFLFLNRGDGRFEEVGVNLGVAFDRNGSATGAMGTDAAHYRNDEDLGVAVGNFANEMTSLYVTQGDPEQFADESIGDGIGPGSRRALTFGLFFFDYDLDGRLDLLQANGHLENEINAIQPSQHYAQPAQLFWNCGVDCPYTFIEVPPERTADLATPVIGRGAAYADIDADGDLDVVITQIGGRPLLLRNDQTLGRHWLRVVLKGRTANRDAIGAWVELRAGGRTQLRQLMTARGYLSQMERVITFGLGDAERAESLVVTWPDGSRQRLEGVAANQTLAIRQQ